MKSFETWIQNGPLGNEPLTERARNLLKIAYLEGAAAAIEEHTEALNRLGATIGGEARAS